MLVHKKVSILCRLSRQLKALYPISQSYSLSLSLSLSLSKAHTITLLLQINSHFFRKGTRGARMPNEKFRNRQRNNSLFLPTASPSPCLCSSILTTTFHVYVSRLSIYLLSIFHCLVCFLSSRPFSRSLPMFVVRRECEAAESEQNFRTLQKFSSYFFFFSYNNTPTHPIAKWRLSVWEGEGEREMRGWERER